MSNFFINKKPLAEQRAILLKTKGLVVDQREKLKLQLESDKAILQSAFVEYIVEKGKDLIDLAKFRALRLRREAAFEVVRKTRLEINKAHVKISRIDVLVKKLDEKIALVNKPFPAPPEPKAEVPARAKSETCVVLQFPDIANKSTETS